MAAIGVQTTTGWLDSPPDADMLMHEHLIAGYIGSEWDPAAQPDLAVERLRMAEHLKAVRAKHGVGLIVDAGSAPIGRDVSFLASLAAASGVHIVASSGFYVANRGGFPFHFQKVDDHALDAFITHELVRGVIGSGGIKCGAIKVGSAADQIDPHELRAFRSAGRVSRRLGTPILTHTDLDGWKAGNVGLHQLETLLQAGAAAARIAIGHVYVPLERLEWVIEICRAGAFVAFDHCGWNNGKEEDAVVVQLVVAMARAGYVDQILLSHDWPAVWRGEQQPIFLSGPGQPFEAGFGYIREKILPALLRAGLTEAEFITIIRRNPWRFLAHAREVDTD